MDWTNMSLITTQRPIDVGSLFQMLACLEISGYVHKLCRSKAIEVKYI